MSYHWKDDDITIETVSKKGPFRYKVTFENCETGVKITMRIPKSGLYDDPESTHELTPDEAKALAIKIANVLRQELQEPPQLKKPKRPKRPIRPKK
jgi:hypothetical protein